MVFCRPCGHAATIGPDQVLFDFRRLEVDHITNNPSQLNYPEIKIRRVAKASKPKSPNRHGPFRWVWVEVVCFDIRAHYDLACAELPHRHLTRLLQGAWRGHTVLEH